MSTTPAPLLTSISQYPRLIASLGSLSESARRSHYRNLCLTDLYFLLRYALRRADIEKQWLLDRCREVQASPNGHLDLWAREHYKSTIITFGLTIQDILRDPEITVALFSHIRPLAKSMLRQIKLEFEGNELLKDLFSDILWAEPTKDAPKWSEDDGLIVKRKSNPRESTLEAWGVVESQPIGKHFKLLVYDDLVTQASVTNPDSILKTTDALALSYNLGAMGGERRFIGTRYHQNDTYRVIIERGTVKPRVYTATQDGTEAGTPVFMTRELLMQKRQDMGPYIFGAQMLQDPTADSLQGFKRSWMRWYHTTPVEAGGGTNKYLLVDAANEKRENNDYTAMWIIGLGSDGNYYVLDMIRDRLNLTERADAVFMLHKRWKPIGVRYEKYGLMADTAHIRDRQERQNYRFQIDEVGGQTPKNDRIKRLVPDMEQGKWYFPETLHYTDYQKHPRDLVHDFVEQEFVAFPVGLHDDMLDALARIAEPDLPLIWPTQEVEETRDRYSPDRHNRTSAWAA